MNVHDVKVAIADLVNKLYEGPDGVAYMEVVAEFKHAYRNEIPDLSLEFFDDWLRRVSKEYVSRAGRVRSEQLTLPGLGEVDAFVTIPDGEGGFRRKKLVFATEADLDADERTHDENVDAAVKARAHIHRRNALIRPVMREQGFTVAGDAIAWLNTNGEDA